MSATGIHTLDNAPNIVGDWLEELRDAAGFQNNQRTYLLLRTVLHTLRDWTPTDEAAQLSAQLPLLIGGVFFEGWNPTHEVPRPHGKREFLKTINDAFADAPLDDTEDCIRAVMELLERHVSSGEMRDVMACLPADVRQILA